MTTDTILDMSYIAKISVKNNTEIPLIDIQSVAEVLGRLLGAGEIIEGRTIAGTIEVVGSDLEAIHEVLNTSESIDIRIGIARNKALAEVALLWGDRTGITHITVTDEDTYLAGIPVAEINGISQLVARQMRKFQIYTAYDLKHSSKEFIAANFSGEVLALYLAYNDIPVIEPATSWYKQVSVGKLSKYIGEVFTKDSDSVIEKRTNRMSQCYNEPDTVSSVLNLFNYQHVEKPL